MNDQLLSLLGLMRRAGKLALGFDAAVASGQCGQAKLILTASDISPKSAKELEFALSDTAAHVERTKYTQQDFAEAIGRAVKIIAIEDSGFAKKAKSLLEAQSVSGSIGEESV